MDGLYLICENHGIENCHPDLRGYAYAQEKKPGEKIRYIPSTRNELIKSDEICKKCEFRLIKIEKKECPSCENKDIQLIGAKEIERELGPPIKGIFYKCNECNTELISDEEL